MRLYTKTRTGCMMRRVSSCVVLCSEIGGRARASRQGLRGALWNSSAGLPPSLGLLCVSYGKEMAFDPNDQTVVHVRFTFAVVGVWRSLLEDFLLYLMQFTRFQAIYPESVPNSCIRAWLDGLRNHATQNTWTEPPKQASFLQQRRRLLLSPNLPGFAALRSTARRRFARRLTLASQREHIRGHGRLA